MSTTTKFTGKAGIYAEHRPSYPTKLIEYLSQFISANDVIGDIGAGTGIFSKCLLEKGYNLIGVEPNDEMRTVAEELLDQYPNFQLLPGTAEATGLSENQLSLITVAQAFHWFDADAFKKECQRVLKPNKMVALIWNQRDESNPFVKEYEQINQQYCPGFKGFSQGIEANQIKSFFKDQNCEISTFPHVNHMDLEGFIGRALSSSYAPKEGDSGFEPYIGALTKLYKSYSQEGGLEFPLIATVYLGEF